MQAVDPKKFNTEQLTFNNGYYDIKIGEFAGAADHSGFYPNSENSQTVNEMSSVQIF